jgi:hypothetical protein
MERWLSQNKRRISTWRVVGIAPDAGPDRFDISPISDSACLSALRYGARLSAATRSSVMKLSMDNNEFGQWQSSTRANSRYWRHLTNGCESPTVGASNALSANSLRCISSSSENHLLLQGAGRFDDHDKQVLYTRASGFCQIGRKRPRRSRALPSTTEF